MLRKIIAIAALAASAAALTPSAASAQEWGHGGGHARVGYGGGHGERWAGASRHDGGGYRGHAGNGRRWGNLDGNRYYSGNNYNYPQRNVRRGGHGRDHGNGYYRH